MSDILEFVSAVLGPYDGPISFDVGVYPMALSTSDEIEAAVGSLRIQALQAGGVVPFVWGLMEETGPDAWQDCRLKPTAVLWKGDKLLLFWAFDGPRPQEQVQAFADAFDAPFDEPVPTPGTDDWVLAYADPLIFYTPTEFTEAYGEEPPPIAIEPPPWDEAPVKWADATIMTPGYSVDADPDMQKPYIVTVGASRDSMSWKPQTMALGQIFATLATHKEGKKDGLSFVLGDMAPGMRKIDAVKSLTFVGLDLDTGMDGAELDRRLDALRCKAIRYTTHSHMKGVTEVRKDTMTRWAIKNEIDPKAPDLVQRYLQQEKHYDPAVAKTAVVFEEKHANEGITLVVHHAPMPKHRIVLPLAQPFFIAKEGNTQKEAQARWRLVPQALARLLGDLPIDRTGSDANRLYYLGRHEKGGQYEVSIFGGKLFDWTKVELGDPLAELAAEMNKGRSKSVTPEGRELGRWFMKKGHGFQIADVIRDNAPERVRSDMGTKIEVECPFDENHHNAGDPNDRACMVANAGDGIADGFVVSCRHEGCQEKTSLDMVGKMIADQWFDRSVLEEEAYNALAPEDAPNPEVAVAIQEADDARAEYEVMVDNLTKNSKDEELEAVLKRILEADLSVIDRVRIDNKIKKTMGFTEKHMKAIYAGPKADLRDKTAKKPKSSTRRDADGRIIFAYSGEPDMVTAAEVCRGSLEDANEALPWYAHLDQQPVAMVENGSGRVSFRPMTSGKLWAELNDRVTFMRLIEDAKEGARDFVPKLVAEQLFHKAPEFLPEAPKIIYTPIFNSQGQLISEPGWYPEDGLMVASSAIVIPEVPQYPTDEEVETAKQHLIGELLFDYPFLDVDDNGDDTPDPSRAHALAMLLTPFMRPMISGCTPVFFVTKPIPGLGGTMLGEIPIRLFLGLSPTPMNYTENQEEMSKALLSAALNATRFMFFDDVKAFNNREIMRATTSGNVGGRLLGGNNMAEVANDFTWIATGNNPYITPEMGRRICWIRMNGKLTPEELNRRVFRHPEGNTWIMETREVSIHALLTLIQNWIAKGKPEFLDRKLTSFEDWSRSVGGVLASAGISGFLDNAKAVEADITESAIRQLVTKWFEKYNVNRINSKDLYDLATTWESELIDGNAEDSRTKKKFVGYLKNIESRTFEIGERRIMVVHAVDQNRSPVYFLRVLPTDEEELAA
jgi:hypothetical protein